MRPIANCPPSVECRGLVAGYSASNPVVRDFDLSVRGPGLHRLDGRNGAGKSTLIEVLSGYLRPLNGLALVNGVPAHSPSARSERRIARTAPALYPYMNVEDHLIFASRLTGGSVTENLERAEHLGLGDWLSERADSLSTGSTRKLWYLMCTTGPFSVVALDEPFNGLDEAATRVICEELTEWSNLRLVLVVCHAVPTVLKFDITHSLTLRRRD